MKTKPFIIWMCLLLWIIQTPRASAQKVRTEKLLEKGWRFIRGDSAVFSLPDYQDHHWEEVRIPHDWAIYGPFSVHNDRQHVAITQDGQKLALYHAGRTGGLPIVGTGWYRLLFDSPDLSNGRKVLLLFDGAMSNAQVFLNGHKIGGCPYGYSSFYFDITSYLHEERKNLLAVRLENEPVASRWYCGAGLYRNVHLIVTEDVHIPLWGTRIHTPVVREDYACVELHSALIFPEGKTAENYRIVTEIINPINRVVAVDETFGNQWKDEPFHQDFLIHAPLLWSPETPSLYKAVSKIYEGDVLKDEYITIFGIRSLAFVPNKGFFLNGKYTRFQGVCNHHDLGPLGGIANEAGIRRQLMILKDMGCNAIRTSHNMPAPELVRLCDEMGFMLMAESFDEWETAKEKNGYHKYFKDWAEKDLTNLILRYRNHPSVVMWCIGNEVPDQRNAQRGPKLSHTLQEICHRYDPTRPVTQGMDAIDKVLENNVASVMDIPGFNYRPDHYEDHYARLPQQLVLGSETASTVSSRGVYKFPVERQSMKLYDDHQASSYDVEHCGWSNLPEDDFIQHESLPYSLGEFVWTGFDYLGEPTPYYINWPSHSSLFGIVDLAGIPKDRYYLYRSHWNKRKETLHILPHWNWEGREGEITPVFVYTNYPEAELFINGKSCGRRKKDLSVNLANSKDSVSRTAFKRQKRYRLMWMDTRYEPGTIKVVAYNESGKPVAEKELHTAGEPYRIELIPDRQTICADGRDLAFVTVKIVDKKGRLCPKAACPIQFFVSGKGKYRAGANGNPACIEPFHLPQMHTFSGMMTAIVESCEAPGTIHLTASSPGLVQGEITIHSVLNKSF